jgi:beta-lactamase class A
VGLRGKLQHVDADHQQLFTRAACHGQLCVQPLDGNDEVALHADQPVVSASVFKVVVALEAETQFLEGRLNARERVVAPAAQRTVGPSGLSLFQDDVELSMRDLVVQMLTVSDNAATDLLLHRVTIDAVNARAAQLGLLNTVVATDMRAMISSLAHDAGFSDWSALMAALAHAQPEVARDRVMHRLLGAKALNPTFATRTTPREMATLLRLIWTGRAAPWAACERVRELMGQQLVRNRIAAAFPAPARVAAKSGSLAGVVRNEIGVVELSGGERYVAAVFTQALRPWQAEAAVNAAIGAAVASAIELLRARAPVKRAEVT